MVEESLAWCPGSLVQQGPFDSQFPYAPRGGNSLSVHVALRAQGRRVLKRTPQPRVLTGTRSKDCFRVRTEKDSSTKRYSWPSTKKNYWKNFGARLPRVIRCRAYMTCHARRRQGRIRRLLFVNFSIFHSSALLLSGSEDCGTHYPWHPLLNQRTKAQYLSSCRW